jgi:hypothetical protein
MVMVPVSEEDVPDCWGLRVRVYGREIERFFKTTVTAEAARERRGRPESEGKEMNPLPVLSSSATSAPSVVKAALV